MLICHLAVVNPAVERVVTGGEVVDAAGELVRRDVVCRGGRIVELCEPGRPPGGEVTIDAAGCVVAPGFIDLQINGGFGYDFTTDPGSIAQVAARLPSFGVTAFAPTIITAPPAARVAAIKAIGAVRRSPLPVGSAVPLGLHFEGPVISPERAGAHAVEWIGDPGVAETDGWSAARGIAIVTLAPEVAGAAELIRGLVSRGVVVSAGHTACTAAGMIAAREAGVTAVTHLFNAMPPFAHRAPGPAGATLADDRLVAGLICDGIHVDPITVQAAWRALGPARTLLVSDAVAALGAADGELTLAGRAVAAGGDTGVRNSDGVLAGSDLPLDRAVRNLVAYTGCSLAAAISTVTSTPADLLGLADRGRLAVGNRADLVVLDRALRPVCTMIGGDIAWRS